MNDGISPEPASDDATRNGKSDGITTRTQFERPAENPDANSAGKKKRTAKTPLPINNKSFFNVIHH